MPDPFGSTDPLCPTPADAAPLPSRQSQRALDWLNFFLADVQTGVGAYVATYLVTQGWAEGQIGWMLTVGGLAGMVCQGPGGALVDTSRSKRALVAGALLVIAAGAIVFAVCPGYWPVMLAQVSHGVVGGAMGPAVAAISLGLVGRRALAVRNGRNHSFDAAGNIAAALLMGWVGYRYSIRAIFLISAALSIPALIALWRIRPEEIDYARARGAVAGRTGMTDGGTGEQSAPERVWTVFRDRRLLVFAACAVMFHFANAAMLPLLGEMLAKGRAVRQIPALLSACLIVTQAVVMLLATPVGWGAERWGRRPLLLIAFAALPVRGVLYTLTTHPALLIAVQFLDGVGAVLFGVVSVLIIADLTQGTGRFNLAQSVVGTAVGIGASTSNAVAGWVVQRAGFNAGFLSLAGVAAVATAMFWFLMPETRDAAAANENKPALAST